MLMAGKHKITVDTTTVANGDSLAAYLTDSAGNFLTSQVIDAVRRLDVNIASEYAEDSPHTSGDYGTFIMGVRNDAGGSFASTDGDYTPLSIDSTGNLRVSGTLNVDFSYDYDEDAAHTSGDTGAFVLAVRQDTLASSTSADGDYAAFKVNGEGELYITNETGNASLASILAEIESYTHAEDAPHVSGDAGIMSLAVRNDAGGALAGTDGDYAPLQVDAAGNLRITGSVTVSGNFNEDAAHTSGDSGVQILGVRKDAAGTNTSADGDYSSLITWSNGELKVVDISNAAILQQQIEVQDTATALPTTALANRKSILIQNANSQPLWIGSATVTTAGATTGIEIPKGGFIELECGPAVTVYGIASGGQTTDVNILEAS